MWDGDHILYEIRAPGRDTVVGTDTIPNSQMENDLPSGGPNGLAYGVVGYTYGLNIDEPIAIVRMGSTHSGITDPTVIFPHTGWRGMLVLATDTAGRRIDCPIGGNICIPIDLPGGNATVDRGKKVEVEPLSWFGSLASSGAEQSGLQYKRNRFFDPKRGQFTQADPIGLGGGTNLYGFASGDAVNFDDPFGLCPPIEDCLQQMADWGARGHGTSRAVALNVASALNSVNDFNPLAQAFDAGYDIGSGHIKAGVIGAALVVGGGEIGRGLKGASSGLRALFSESGGLENGTLIGIRSSLKNAGFAMKTASSGKGYLFTNEAGEEVRLMKSDNGWYLRAKNAASNYLDENGNPGNRASSHIPVTNR